VRFAGRGNSQMRNLDVATGARGHRHGMRDLFVDERVAVPVRLLERRYEGGDALPDALRTRLEAAMQEKAKTGMRYTLFPKRPMPGADINRELERRRRERVKGHTRALYEWSATSGYNEASDAVTVHVRQPMRPPNDDDVAEERPPIAVDEVDRSLADPRLLLLSGARSCVSNNESVLECRVLEVSRLIVRAASPPRRR